MLLVEPFQLVRVEDGVSAADAFERERIHELVGREHLLIRPGRPPEKREEIHHRLGQNSLSRVLHHGGGAVTLAQSLLVGTEDERHVRELRQLGANRAVQQDLFRRVRDVIVAPHHMRDRHLHIVRDDRELICGMTVGAKDDEIFDVRAVERDWAVDEIPELHGAVGHLETDRARHAVPLARGDVVGRQTAACAVVLPAAARLLCGVAPYFQFLGRAVAVVRMTARYEPIGHGAIPIEALRLKVRAVGSVDVRALVPIQPEPPKAVENAFDHVGRGSLDVGVLDSQDEHAAGPPGEQPVEERRPRAADVQISGGRRGESNADQRDVNLRTRDVVRSVLAASPLRRDRLRCVL